MNYLPKRVIILDGGWLEVVGSRVAGCRIATLAAGGISTDRGCKGLAIQGPILISIVRRCRVVGGGVNDSERESRVGGEEVVSDW